MESKSLITIIDEVDHAINSTENCFILELPKAKINVPLGNYFDLIVHLEKRFGEDFILESPSRQLPVPYKINIITTENLWQDRETMEMIRDSPYVIAYPTHKCKKLKRAK